MRSIEGNVVSKSEDYINTFQHGFGGAVENGLHISWSLGYITYIEDCLWETNPNWSINFPIKPRGYNKASSQCYLSALWPMNLKIVFRALFFAILGGERCLTSCKISHAILHNQQNAWTTLLDVFMVSAVILIRKAWHNWNVRHFFFPTHGPQYVTREFLSVGQIFRNTDNAGTYQSNVCMNKYQGMGVEAVSSDVGSFRPVEELA